MIEQILIPASLLGGLGLIFGLGLAFASKKFEVKVDERIAQIREVLPGANCGACGQTGCDGFAECVAAGTCPINGCPVGGVELAKKLGAILGVDAGSVEPKTARVMCSGTFDKCASKFAYSGIEDCTAAANLYGGPSSCSYGCVGMGSCKKVCPFDAILVENGVARIIESRCTSCGKCVAACPKKIIKIVPSSNEYTVSCSSLDKGNIVKRNCSTGCIGCSKCIKTCSNSAIELNGTLAEINPDMCSNCGECIKVCPTNAIKKYMCKVE